MLRVLFTLVVQQVLDIKLLKLVGGLLLFWIAVKLLIADEGDGGRLQERHQPVGGGAHRRRSPTWSMSLDNVLAIAAAAHGDP